MIKLSIGSKTKWNYTFVSFSLKKHYIILNTIRKTQHKIEKLNSKLILLRSIHICVSININIKQTLFQINYFCTC